MAIPGSNISRTLMTSLRKQIIDAMQQRGFSTSTHQIILFFKSIILKLITKHNNNSTIIVKISDINRISIDRIKIANEVDFDALI